MSVHIKPDILCACNFFHHYFLDLGARNFEEMTADEKLSQLSNYEVSNFMEVVPTEDCLSQLKGHKMLLHPTTTGFIISINSDDSGLPVPLVEFSENTKLTFLLKLRESTFYNYSDLSMSISENQFFYFNNLNKTGGGKLSLSKESASGNFNLKQVGTADLMKIFQPIQNYELQTGTTGTTLTISKINTTATPQKVFEKTVSLLAGETKYQFDLRHLPSGLYQLIEENGGATETTDFYLNNRSFPARTFGILEIFGTQNTNNNFALLTTTGRVKASYPNFEIRFNNRKTKWRYHFSNDQQITAGANVEFEDINNQKIIISTDNHPLTEKGLVEVKKGNNVNDKLPNPSPKMIVPDNDNNSVYSEIYL